MATKQDVIRALAEVTPAGGWISGQKLADRLGVTRMAVWKAVQTLQREGVLIEAAPRSGYRLSAQNDPLTESALRAALSDAVPGLAHMGAIDTLRSLQLQVYTRTDSTNRQARLAAEAGAAEGLVILADMQYTGRGRMGRTFYAPPGTGLYMSVLLRPTLRAAEAVLLTSAAAVAVCEAISDVCGREAGIRWVNDVLLDGRKVCGILTEAAFDAENERLKYAVVGIGINVYTPQQGWPVELKTVAGAVCGQPQSGLRARLAAQVILRLWGYYRQLASRSFLPEYRRRLLYMGERVTLTDPQSRHMRTVVLLGVDDGCRLLVRLRAGQRELINAGEISLRPQSAPAPQRQKAPANKEAAGGDADKAKGAAPAASEAATAAAAAPAASEAATAAAAAPAAEEAPAMG